MKPNRIAIFGIAPLLLGIAPAVSSCSAESFETFSVVAPTMVEAKTEGTVIPRIADFEGNRFPIPEARFYLKDGTEVDKNYVGIGTYTLDISYGAKGKTGLEGVKKVIVNQTHEETVTYHYYRGVVHEWGKYRYFALEDTAHAYSQINYVLYSSKLSEGDIVLAGIRFVDGSYFDPQILISVENEEGEQLFLYEWAIGPLIV